MYQITQKVAKEHLPRFIEVVNENISISIIEVSEPFKIAGVELVSVKLRTKNNLNFVYFGKQLQRKNL